MLKKISTPKKSLKDLSTVAERINWNFTIGNCASLTLFRDIFHETQRMQEKKSLVRLPKQIKINTWLAVYVKHEMHAWKFKFNKVLKFHKQKKKLSILIEFKSTELCVCMSSSVWDRERSSNDNIEEYIDNQNVLSCHVYIETMLMQDACSSLTNFFPPHHKTFLCISRALFYWFSGKCNSLCIGDAWKLGWWLWCQWLLFLRLSLPL